MVQQTDDGCDIPSVYYYSFLLPGATTCFNCTPKTMLRQTGLNYPGDGVCAGHQNDYRFLRLFGTQ